MKSFFKNLWSWINTFIFCFTHSKDKIAEEIKILKEKNKEMMRLQNLPDDTFGALVEAHRIIIEDKKDKQKKQK